MEVVKNTFTKLSCMSCGEEYSTETFSLCLKCDGILTASYHIDHPIDLNKSKNSIWKFREYLPPIKSQNIVSMGEGWTPLINADEFAEMAGLSKSRLVCKMESQNPTGSFKDRPASLSVSLANVLCQDRWDSDIEIARLREEQDKTSEKCR